MEPVVVVQVTSLTMHTKLSKDVFINLDTHEMISRAIALLVGLLQEKPRRVL